MMDLTLRNINRLLVLPFKNGDNDRTRNCFNEYYVPFPEIKDFDPLIDNKLFIDQPLKTNEKRIKNLLKCQATITIQQESYQITYIIKITINLLVQIHRGKQVRQFLNQLISHKKLEEDAATMVFIALERQKTILNFSLYSLIVTE